jgi:predicted ribosomally synthesized six-cysteine peptide SCIFF
MKHIKIIAQNSVRRGAGTACGECQSSCQSACKTSCTVGNQSCEQKRINRTVKDTEQK